MPYVSRKYYVLTFSSLPMATRPSVRVSVISLSPVMLTWPKASNTTCPVQQKIVSYLLKAVT